VRFTTPSHKEIKLPYRCLVLVWPQKTWLAL